MDQGIIYDSMIPVIPLMILVRDSYDSYDSITVSLTDNKLLNHDTREIIS